MRITLSAAILATTFAALIASLFVLRRNLQQLQTLENERPLHGSNPKPRISVLIPARNEADSLPSCLGSLERQTYSNFEVIVLDDESSDGTPDLVADFEDRDDRFRLIAGEPLPTGWYGKPWACQQLGNFARGEILLFIDADTWYEPDVLSRVAGLMSRDRPGLMSVLPRQVTESFLERLVVPGLYTTFLAGYPIWRVDDPDYPDYALANGQFLCFDARAHWDVGGHETVKDQLIEDLAFAQRMKHAGFRVIARKATSSVFCRMYRSNRDVIDGFSKNAYGALGERVDIAVAAILVLYATHIAPIVSLAIWRRTRSGYLEIVLALGTFVTNSLIRAIVARHFRFRTRDAFLGPVSGIAYIGIILRSIWWKDLGSGYQWKGRHYRRAAIR